MNLRHQKTLRLEPLEGRALLSTLLAESEPNNRRGAADILTLDAADGAATVNGSIANRRDQDFFRVVVPTAGTLNLSFVDAGAFRGKVEVESAAGRGLFENEPNDGRDDGSFAVQAGQVLFIRVRGQGKSIGAYSLGLSLDDGTTTGGSTGGTDDGAGHDVGDDNGGAAGGTGGGADDGTGHDVGDDRGGATGGTTGGATGSIAEAESNNEKAQATRFALDAAGKAQLRGTSTSDKDKDFFVFTPTASGRLTVTLSGDPAKLEIEDASGRSVLEIEPERGTTGTLTVTAGTRLFVRLRSPGKGAASYTVDLALS